MYVQFDHPKELVTTTQTSSLEADEFWLILLAKCHQPQLEATIEALNATQTRFFGGIFPGLIHQNSALYEGAILKKLHIIEAPVRIPLPVTIAEAEALLPESGLLPSAGATCITLMDSCRSVSTIC